MRLLLVHADRFAFEVAAGAGGGPAENEGVQCEGEMADCVAAFVTVDRGDAADPDSVVANAAAELRDATDRLNTEKVALYPSAHLSDAPASADSAAAVLRDLASELDADREVLRAPLSAHTALELARKGHPYATDSRRVSPGNADPGEEADRPPSEWRLVFPGGDDVALPQRDPLGALDDECADRVGDDLRAVVAHEVGDGIDSETPDGTAGEDDRPAFGDLLGERRPAFGDLVSEQRLASDGRSADDAPTERGTFRWLPRGKLIRDVLTEYAADLAADAGAVPVETSRADRLGMGTSPADVESSDERRPRRESSGTATASQCASCAEHLAILDDAGLDAADLPVSLSELTAGPAPSGGECNASDLPLPESPVPVVHTATADLAGARERLVAQADLALRAGEALGLPVVPIVRTTRAFRDENGDWVESLVDELGAPAPVELRPERRDCRAFRVDVATPDGLSRPAKIGHVTLDVATAERSGVTYEAGEGTRHPPILHFAPLGSVDDALAAVLGAAAGRETPRLPTWLAPTQVRFVPVDERHADHCDALAADLESAEIRVDVDDRDEPVGERLARAADDWVPYCAVVGDRETERGAATLKATVRGEGAERELTPAELEAAVLADVGDAPTMALPLPRRLNRRPNLWN